MVKGQTEKNQRGSRVVEVAQDPQRMNVTNWQDPAFVKPSRYLENWDSI